MPNVAIVFLAVLVAGCPTNGGKTEDSTPTTPPLPTGTTSTGTPPTTTIPTDTGLPTPFADIKLREAWTYLPLKGMICADGSPTGIGVNPTDDPLGVVIAIAGGGACWDEESCYTNPVADNLDGWGINDVAASTAGLDASVYFDRKTKTNPWSDYTWVLVPYCTADLHAGDAQGFYDTKDPSRVLHHAGDANLVAVLDRLSIELPGAERSWVMGFSAGGYGAQLQADRFEATWPGADIALLADGAPMVTPLNNRYDTWNQAWNLRLPEPCATCTTSLEDTLGERLAPLNNTRLALVTSRIDPVIPDFFEYAKPDLGAAVDALVKAEFIGNATANAFVTNRDDHIQTDNPFAQSTGGDTLLPWLILWRDDDAAWTDTH